MKTINVKKLNVNATIPTYGSDESGGCDLYACGNEEDFPIVIEPHSTVKIGTGLSMEIPYGYGGLILARSGLSSKKGLAPANKVGLIDSDYRGEIIVALHNHSDETSCVNFNDRIAQLMVVPFLKLDFKEVDELSETIRGEGGFGSTDEKTNY